MLVILLNFWFEQVFANISFGSELGKDWLKNLFDGSRQFLMLMDCDASVLYRMLELNSWEKKKWGQPTHINHNQLITLNPVN